MIIIYIHFLLYNDKKPDAKLRVQMEMSWPNIVMKFATMILFKGGPDITNRHICIQFVQK